MKGQHTMSNKQLNSFLESLKIIVENATDKESILKAIEQPQSKLK
jgi:hypothetical protein